MSHLIETFQKARAPNAQGYRHPYSRRCEGLLAEDVGSLAVTLACSAYHELALILTCKSAAVAARSAMLAENRAVPLSEA